MPLLSPYPYYYGKYKWDNYLLDIESTIQAANTAQQQNTRLQTKALTAAHEQQLTELRQQTEQMRRVEEALNGGFEELRAEFEWGFTLIVDRMESQIEQLSQIAARLDAIHKTLQSPLLTQARELFQLGQEHFRKGLLDKALDAYLKAEQKNDVDFPLQLQIGKLFLYGRDEDDDVIDLPKSEKHLLLAARYADAEKGTFPQWAEYCGQAYFHAAVASYLIGEQEHAAGRLDSMRSCLERALGYLNKAAILWPRFTEIIYTQAKCYALLGQVQDSAGKLEILSDRDRRYFAKASQDGDFEAFRVDVDELFKRATITPGPLARAAQSKLDEVREAISWAKRSAPTSTEDLTAIESIERELSKAKQALSTLDVDIENLHERLDRMRASLEKITRRSFQNNLDGSQQAIASLEVRKRGSENSIEHLKQTMKATRAAGMAWLFFFLFYFVASSGVAVILTVMPELKSVGAVLAFAAVGVGIVGARLGSRISRDKKNGPHKLKIEEHSRTISECIRTLPSLVEQTEACKHELHRFELWNANLSSPQTTPPTDHGGATITLISAGGDKINMIKAVREVTGLDLKGAKDLVDNAPRLIKRGVNHEEAEAIRKKFADAGARVEIT